MTITIQLTPEQKALRYWGRRAKQLYRSGFAARLYQEGPSVCYHGATGENRRFAQWRLAYHETVRRIQSTHNGEFLMHGFPGCRVPTL